MPIKHLTENRRMPRIGKIHLGIKITNAQNKTYPQATDYFVWPAADAHGGEVLDQLIKTYGEKPNELQIVFALNDEESIASQYYRCYTRSRGLVCRGDGETSVRLLDTATGDLPTPDSKNTELKAMLCAGRDCPQYVSSMCREVMNLQFMLPTISGMGIWQIDTSSINSIRNINNCLQVIKAIYKRLDLIPLTLSLEPIEVTPPGGMRKTVRVLNIRSQDSIVQALMKAQMSPLELMTGKPPDSAKAQRDINELWGDESSRALSPEEAAERMSPEEIDDALGGEEAKKVKELPPATDAKAVMVNLLAFEFANQGEFYTACYDHLHLPKSRVDAEIPEYDLTKPGQRKKAWQQIVAVYEKPPATQ